MPPDNGQENDLSEAPVSPENSDFENASDSSASEELPREEPNLAGYVESITNKIVNTEKLEKDERRDSKENVKADVYKLAASPAPYTALNPLSETLGSLLRPVQPFQTPSVCNSNYFGVKHRFESLRSPQEKPEAQRTRPIRPHGYTKPNYTVLIRDDIKVCNTKLYASLPQQSKYLVKEKIWENGQPTNKVRFKLMTSDDGAENDDNREDREGIHYRENCKTPGLIIFTSDKKLFGNTKYPLPNKSATNKIGKGGNGFVFTIYHQNRQFAVKKTVYRPNEVNVHSSLKHKNILPLLAVLMGERHEHHSQELYCFHLMPKMDYDLRQALSATGGGCLKHLYGKCSKDPRRWEFAYSNIKFILGETLKALVYIHGNRFVHRDVKASNIMIKMQCQCQPLSCRCSSKFQVKLGDFDSAGTVPGLDIKEPTDQMIKFASILPLGTQGYRAPEVSMHITLSGPYETLYTFAVDMWSFGCLCLNICIGKTAALKQREEASLLLSRTHQCSKELWEKTTKIHELEQTQPFSKDLQLLSLVRRCLQVDWRERPSALEAQMFL